MLNPSVQVFIDDQEYSHSPDLTIESDDDSTTNVLLKPHLTDGVHILKCIISNQSNHKRTIVSRSFRVHSQQAGPILTHVQLQSQHSNNDGITEYGLEYPTSGKTAALMHIDWSRLMIYLNPLILTIIFICYWGCRTLGNRILRQQADTELLSKLDSSTGFFATNRTLKYGLLKDYFCNWNWFFRILFTRLFLFTTDNLIFTGVCLTLLCRLIIPHFFIDEASDLCSISIWRYRNYHTGERFQYMDPYVFGTAYYYSLMVLLTLYLFLFASPSISKTISYPFASYLLVMLDVSMVFLFYKLIIKGAQKKSIRSLPYLLNRLNDPISLLIIVVLIVREKLISYVSYK